MACVIGTVGVCGGVATGIMIAGAVSSAAKANYNGGNFEDAIIAGSISVIADVTIAKVTKSIKVVRDFSKVATKERYFATAIRSVSIKGVVTAVTKNGYAFNGVVRLGANITKGVVGNRVGNYAQQLREQLRDVLIIPGFGQNNNRGLF